MRKVTNRIPPALKHGCYSGASLLPTEDQTAFDRLHQDLIAEYTPNGRSEVLTIEILARLMWRRENLAIYGLAALAKKKYHSICAELSPPPPDWSRFLGNEQTRTPEELIAFRKDVDERAQRELGSALELVTVGEITSTDHLLEELALIERLDGMIVRCLKQLLLVRGVKSMPPSGINEALPTRMKRVA